MTQPPPAQPPTATPEPWDLVADAYETEVMPLLETFARQALRLAGLPPAISHEHNARVLDVACGTGTLALLAAHGGYHVDALDFSPRMIELLARRVSAESVSRLAPHHGDGQKLPFPDKHYAAAFSMFGLMFFPDRARGFAELRRVLVPGGRAVIASWHPLQAIRPLQVIFGALGEVMPGPGGELPLTTADACAREMAAAGFAGVDVHTIVHVDRHDSPRLLWEGIQRTMAPIALARQKLADRWTAASEHVASALARELGDGPVELPLTAWLTVGTAPA